MTSGRQDEAGSGLPRSSSSATSSRQSTASQSSDAYTLSDIPVADGFRPSPDTSSSSSGTITPRGTNTMTAARQHFNESASPEQSASFRNRPSSVAKPHRPHESLTLRHERANASPAQPSFPRSSIASSEAPVMRPDSPYRGPTGPSHPYQMYPQRTLSNATASTTTPAPAAHETTPNTQQGPTHPYTLYTQNTAEVEDVPVPSIPVGFNGRSDNYRRQLGPDGEEAGDLIGPMGHTEELPPYTRYPEVAYVRKGSSNDTDSISTPSTSTPAVAALASGAGGLGMATRDPEFSSTEEDLAITRTRPSVRSQRSQASRHDINTAAREINEKPSRQEKWQRRAKKKLWGIVPYWAICLVLVGMVLMGIIMGAVIGTLLNKQDSERDPEPMPESEYNPKPPVIEVDPYTTMPDDLDPIETGFFGLPPLDRDANPKLCFNDTMQAQAWSCDIPYRYYSIDITEIKNASKFANFDLELTAFDESDAQFIWGTQPPSVPKPIPLTLVNDTFDDGRGPAWWLKVKYNKTVIVREENFRLSEDRRRGWDYEEFPAEDFDPTQLKRASKGAMEGDRPWICTWPDTTLEIFIYPNANASLQLPSASSNEPDYAQPTPMYDKDDKDDRKPDPLKAYPKVVKFLERRVSGNPDSKAVCRQVHIINGGYGTKPCLDDDGKPIEVEIVEKSSAGEEQLVADKKREVRREWTSSSDGLQRRDSLMRRGAQELTSCGCLWWST